MRIKHFAGYGCVNARKVKKTDNTLVVHVWGNHERGIELNDNYDIFNWLVKRFDKTHNDYFQIENVDIEQYWEDGKPCGTEHCVYTITFRN